MPDARELIADGLRSERAGAPDRALLAYRSAIDASADPAVHCEAHTRIADVHRELCNWEEGRAAARTAQEIARKAGLSDALADARIAEGNVLMIQGVFTEAMPIFRDIADSHTDPRIRGIALQNLGSMLAQLGQHGAAERAFGESLGNFQKANYLRGQAIALNNLGRLALDRGAFADARLLLERARAEASTTDDAELAALAGQNLASALTHLGEKERAYDLAMSALGYFDSSQNHFRTIECLKLVAELQEHGGDMESARRCLHRALALAEKIESEVEIRVTKHQLNRLARGA